MFLLAVCAYHGSLSFTLKVIEIVYVMCARCLYCTRVGSCRSFLLPVESSGVTLCQRDRLFGVSMSIPSFVRWYSYSWTCLSLPPMRCCYRFIFQFYYGYCFVASVISFISGPWPSVSVCTVATLNGRAQGLGYLGIVSVDRFFCK